MVMGLMAVSGANEDAKTNNRLRLNYGVHFRALHKVYAVTDYWVQVFDVRIPSIPVGNLSRDVPECSKLMIYNCPCLRPVFVEIHAMYASMTKEIKKTQQHITDVLPADRRFGNPHTKRALIPIGGWVLHGLFGTTTDNDLKPIKSQVRRISQGVAQVARGIEVENQRLAGYMSLNNYRLDDLVSQYHG